MVQGLARAGERGAGCADHQHGDAATAEHDVHVLEGKTIEVLRTNDAGLLIMCCISRSALIGLPCLAIHCFHSTLTEGEKVQHLYKQLLNSCSLHLVLCFVSCVCSCLFLPFVVLDRPACLSSLSSFSLSLSLSLSRSRSPALFVAARCFVAPFVVLQGVGCPLLVVLTRMLA